MRILSLALVIVLLSAPSARADLIDQKKLLRNAVLVVEELMMSEDEHIPHDLIAKAKGIVIFPTMVKGGFIIAGRFGKGVAATRDRETGKWGAPAFVYTIGGSYGLQIGAEVVDLVLLLMSERGVEGLLKDKFTLGADVAVTAGPTGRHAEAATDIMFQGEIYSYSRSKGAFAGISIKGTVIVPDANGNDQYYGQPLDAKDILLLDKVTGHASESTRRFREGLDRLLGSGIPMNTTPLPANP